MAKATTVEQYLSQLPEDRREALEALRAVITENIDPIFEEGIQYGMPAWYVPHSVFPKGYHCDPEQPLPFASIASQKGHIGLYLFCIYMSPDLSSWFAEAWKGAGKKLDMGKSCVRVKRLEDIPLDVVGELFRRVKAGDFIAHYEASLTARGTKRSAPRKKKPIAKRPAKKAKVQKATEAKSARKSTARKPARKKLAKKAARR